MAQPTIQFQDVQDAITNIQNQLNSLQSQITKIGSPVTVPSSPAHDLLITEGGSFTLLNMALDTVLLGAGPAADPTATSIPNCADSTHFLSYSTSGHALSAPVVFNNQGSTTTVLHGNAAGNPSFGAVALTTDVSGILPIANGGTGVATGPVVTVTTQVFTASGTYTPHAGLLFAIVECVGGGGAGGGAVGVAGHINSGSGGGAGSYSRGRLTAAQIGASQTVTVGAGGTAGAAGNNPGNNGGDTSLGTLCVGKGGTGGNGAPDLTQVAGGPGGVAGTGDVKPPGNDGQQSVSMSAVTLVPPFPMGGAGPWGGQSNKNSITGAGTFTSGTAGGFGNGGGGAMAYNTNSNGAGAAGAPGIVIVTEFNNQ